MLREKRKIVIPMNVIEFIIIVIVLSVLFTIGSHFYKEKQIYTQLLKQECDNYGETYFNYLENRHNKKIIMSNVTFGKCEIYDEGLNLVSSVDISNFRDIIKDKAKDIPTF